MVDRPVLPPSSSPRRDRLALLVVVLLLLLPFLRKAVNIDGAFFLAIADHITQNPLHPYDFHYNWTGRLDYIWDEMKNPPFIFYFQALLLRLFGRSELLLNAAFLIFPVAAAMAMYALARRRLARPRYASLLLVVSPAFLVSSASLMMDVALLAFYSTAVACFVAGAEQDRNDLRFAAGLAAAIAVLTKYFALTLIPLLAVYAILFRKDLTKNLAVLLLPIVAYTLWHLHGVYYHGTGHFLNAMAYGADRHAHPGHFLRQTISTLTFMGGLLAAPLLAFLPFGRKRAAIGMVLGFAAAIALLWKAESALHFQVSAPNRVLLVLLAAGTLVYLARALSDLFSRQDPFGWLLRLWLWGGIIFCFYFNWTVNARTVLLFAPPALILFARWTENNAALRRTAIALGLAIGLLVSLADYEFAEFGRREAAWVSNRYGDDERVRFVGHWGFQYYMEQAGYRHIDFGNPALESGDRAIIPMMHTASNRPLRELPKRHRIEGVYYRSTWLPVRVMNSHAGAGLHGSFLGLLPFAYSELPVDVVEIWRW